MTPAGTRRLLFNLRIVFLLLFAVGAAGAWAYQIYVVQPKQRCEQAHRWWDPQGRTCAFPVSVTNFTHRPISEAAAKP